MRNDNTIIKWFVKYLFPFCYFKAAKALVSTQTYIFWYEIRGNVIKHDLFDTSVLLIYKYDDASCCRLPS